MLCDEHLREKNSSISAGETDIIDPPEDDASSNLEVKKENEVYVLNPTNFEGFIKSQEVVMVEFYAPW